MYGRWICPSSQHCVGWYRASENLAELWTEVCSETAPKAKVLTVIYNKREQIHEICNASQTDFASQTPKMFGGP